MYFTHTEVILHSLLNAGFVEAKIQRGVSKTTRFLCFQRPQMAKRNCVLHGSPLAFNWLLSRQFFFNHSAKFRWLKLRRERGVLIACQKETAKGQSLKRCSIVSSWLLHKGQVVSQLIPRAATTCLTGTLLW